MHISGSPWKKVLRIPQGLWREAGWGLPSRSLPPSASCLGLTQAPAPRPCNCCLWRSLQFLGRHLPSDSHQGPGWALPPVNSPTNEGDISTSPPVGFVFLQHPGPGLLGYLIKGLTVLLPTVISAPEYSMSVSKEEHICMHPRDL